MSWVIPLALALLLWGGNALLVYLSFYPVRFVGIPPLLGWQGIIPRRVDVIAPRIAHKLTTELATVEEVIQVMGPERIAQHAIHMIRPQVHELVEDTILECQPRLWDALDESCKRDIVVRMQKGLPEAAHGIMGHIVGNVERYADIDLLARSLLVERPHMLVDLITQIAEKEFRLMINAGLYFGLPCGLLALLLWALHPATWVLPVAGALSGAFINWFTLLLIFHPVNPVRIGPLRLHGFFLRRQEEAALVACRVFTRNILNVQNLIDAILNGEHGAEVRQMFRQHLRPVVHEALESRRGMLQEIIRPDEFAELDDLLLERLAEISLVTFDDPVFNHERQVATEQAFVDRVLELTYEEFESLLREGIREEEPLLILGGALTGLLAGFLIFGLVVWLA